ncbi:hypothetical protein ACE1OE_24180 [Vibrio sp. E150_011]
MTDEPKTIQLAEFSNHIIRLMKALSEKGWTGKMELTDLGNFIGNVIITDAKDITELEDAYNDFCHGIHHGIGLSHQDMNSKKTVEEYVNRWEKRRKNHQD